MSAYAALHRAAVREAFRSELAQALHAIETATHAVVNLHGEQIVSCYGNIRVCQEFARGLERYVRVVPMSPEMKERESAWKVSVYRRHVDF